METKQITVADKQILCCVSEDGHLVWPEEWTDELTARGFLDIATSMLAGLDPTALNTPWIIGSGSKNLFGLPRSESASHMEGRAFDMSPMYSDTMAIAPDSPIMGLAWNVMSLIMLSPLTSAGVPFVVEGDHVHVQPGADASLIAPGQFYSVFTFAGWYPWSSVAIQSKLGAAAQNTVWHWDLQNLCLTPPSSEVRNAMLEALSHG